MQNIRKKDFKIKLILPFCILNFALNKPLLASPLEENETARLESQKEDKKLANRVYEVMYIATPEAADDDIARLNDSLQTIISDQGGSVVRVDDMGRRRLAYEINRKKEGYYVLFEIEGSGREIAELERRMRVNDMIMRYLTVRVDEERKTAEKVRAKREKNRPSRGGGSGGGFKGGDNSGGGSGAGATAASADTTAEAQDNQ
jgi:small subunit ribosomal protein S6